MLHALVWFVELEPLRAALTPVLYGLLLLWQPLWSKDTRVNRPPQLAAIFLLLLFSYFYLNESLVFISLLISGLIGSRLFSDSAYRSFDLTAISILIIEMAIGIIPETFEPIEIPPQFASYIQILLMLSILVLFFAPVKDETRQQRSQIDLMHGILSTSLIFITLLGGIVINVLYGVDYIDGLLLTVFIVSTLAIGISWFWNPGVGYSGLGVLWNRYAMTIGGPFETWINSLTTLIEEPYLSANEFLQAACEHLVENDWLNGIQWQLEGLTILAGEKKGVAFEHRLSETILTTIYFKSDPGQALRQHTILLIRMAYQFYLAKLNQDRIRAQEHFETIHHTGARLTHDIKNMLQSIKASIDIVQSDPKSNREKSNRLLKKNLDQISTRLESTLERFSAPELSTSIRVEAVSVWTARLQNENNDPKLTYQIDITLDHSIPTDMFDSVVNNLLNNALKKAEVDKIVIDVIANRDMIMVTVCDNGLPIDPELENRLFIKPVSSGDGMGIGLYQSAIMARSFNYELDLANNRNARVCFSLFQHLGEERTVELVKMNEDSGSA
jgi:signal transduction histidine kinase